MKMLGYRPGFIRLDVADEVPGEIVPAAVIYLVQPFLDEIFAKIPLTRCGGLQNGLQGLFLADRKQPYGSGLW